jgi:vacuolar-type H+-ATPase subunit E/Vma4
MKEAGMKNLRAPILATLCLLAMALPAHAAKPKAPQQAQKERLVLMPLRIPEEEKALQGAMETALVEGLQQKYVVFSGEQVAQKAREIFLKESRNTAKKECDETRCMQGIAEAFQAELIATANVTKQDGGYFLALSIQNIFDNKVEYSKTLTCEGCSAFKTVDKLKELSGASSGAEQAKPARVGSENTDEAFWVEVEKSNTQEDYQLYLEHYPKGRFVAFAKMRLKKMPANPSDSVRAPSNAKVRIYSGDCVFPDSSEVAPDWICDRPVEGYGYQAVGWIPLSGQSNPNDRLPSYQSALLEALSQFPHEQVESSVRKQVSNWKFGNITVELMMKQYNEAKIQIAVKSSKVSMERPCAYTMTRYIETRGEVKTVASSEGGTRCTIQDVVRELAGAGVEVVDHVFSSKGDMYVMLGMTEEFLLKISEKAVQSSMQNDKAAWEKFKSNAAQ